MRIIAHILIVAIGLLAIAEFVPGIAVESFTIAVIAALVLGVLNVVIRPILLTYTSYYDCDTRIVYVRYQRVSLFSRSISHFRLRCTRFSTSTSRFNTHQYRKFCEQVRIGFLISNWKDR